jgi:hypothetical protein
VTKPTAPFRGTCHRLAGPIALGWLAAALVLCLSRRGSASNLISAFAGSGVAVHDESHIAGSRSYRLHTAAGSIVDHEIAVRRLDGWRSPTSRAWAGKSGIAGPRLKAPTLPQNAKPFSCVEVGGLLNGRSRSIFAAPERLHWLRRQRSREISACTNSDRHLPVTFGRRPGGNAIEIQF